MSKIKDINDLAGFTSKDRRVVLAGGVFDILHCEHVQHLESAKHHGDILIVHVTSDKRVRQKKGPGKPFVSERERARVVAGLGSVDYVFISDFPHYYMEHIDIIRPSVLYFHQEAYNEKVKNYLDQHKPAVQISVCQTEKQYSTSNIIEKIRESAPHDKL